MCSNENIFKCLLLEDTCCYQLLGLKTFDNNKFGLMQNMPKPLREIRSIRYSVARQNYCIFLARSPTASHSYSYYPMEHTPHLVSPHAQFAPCKRFINSVCQTWSLFVRYYSISSVYIIYIITKLTYLSGIAKSEWLLKQEV